MNKNENRNENKNKNKNKNKKQIKNTIQAEQPGTQLAEVEAYAPSA